MAPPPSDTDDAVSDLFVPTGHVLGAQPQRPGELTATVVVTLGREARRHVLRLATSDGLPLNLWLTIAIDAQRCLSSASALVDVTAEELAQELDRAAVQLSETGGSHPALTRLRAYAEAVREGSVGVAGSAVPPSLPLSPGLQVAAAWALHAERIGVTTECWASDVANALPAGRATWEAASAATGQSLAEWMLAQAARRWR